MMHFDEVWERVCESTRWRKYGEMANFLNIKAQSVSSAKSKGAFPIDWAFKIGQHFGLGTDWLMTGKGLGGPMPAIDEEFFIRVAFAVEIVLRQRNLEISLWQKLRLFVFIYENAITTTGEIDPEMIKKIISLTATNATIAEDDIRILELVENLGSLGATTDNEKIKNVDLWLRQLIEKFNDTGLLATLTEKQKIISWLEKKLEAEKQQDKK